MALKAIRIILGIMLGLAAAGVGAYVVNFFMHHNADLDAQLDVVTLAILTLAAWAAYYYALFDRPNLFKGFRAVLGALVAAVVFYLLGGVAVSVYGTFTAQSFKSAELTGPLARVVVAAVILGIYWYSTVASSPVRRIVENIFSIPELMKKLAFTLALLCIYRIGYHIPLPGLNQEELTNFITQQQRGVFGQALEYLALFTGGNLQQTTLFGLGIMPYISASIIFQLLTTVVPALEKLKKEGPAGYKKIQEYTRYATVALCFIQAALWMRVMNSQGLLYQKYIGDYGVFLMGVMGLTTGTMFLMWLGEQIDEYGIGNGISLIIMAGIVARLPVAVRELLSRATLRVTGGDNTEIGLIKIIFLVASFVFVTAGAIMICQAQRRIPVQTAKHTRGRRVYGGQRQFMPLRVNHGGVMPIIFASSLMIFPSSITRALVEWQPNVLTQELNKAFGNNGLIYQLFYIGLIFFFAYFWTTVQFRPKDMAEQLRDNGNFIPGLRPGRRTADYLERVMERITYCGAAFLSVIAVIPNVLANAMGIPWSISAFLGGTGLLITVSVGLDLVQRIEANLIMRNYGGFLGDSGRIKGAYS